MARICEEQVGVLFQVVADEAEATGPYAKGVGGVEGDSRVVLDGYVGKGVWGQAVPMAQQYEVGDR